MSKNCAVILAGGEGKRMGSDKPKVLCEVLDRPMIDYVVEACLNAVTDICVIVGYKGDMVAEHLGQKVYTRIQHERLGTAHAVMQATDVIEKIDGNILVVCGDAPLMDGETIKKSLELHEQENNAVTVITAKLDDPTGYGRIIKKDGKVCGIVEQKDATPEQLAVNEVNSGGYWFKASELLKILPAIGNNNAQKEYYLTDCIGVALSMGLTVDSFTAASPDVVMGANNPDQLLELAEKMKNKN